MVYDSNSETVLLNKMAELHYCGYLVRSSFFKLKKYYSDTNSLRFAKSSHLNSRSPNIGQINDLPPRITNPVWYGGWEIGSFSERELPCDDDMSVVSDDLSVFSSMALPIKCVPSLSDPNKSKNKVTSMPNMPVCRFI